MKHLYSKTDVVYIIQLNDDKYLYEDGVFGDDIAQAETFRSKYYEDGDEYSWRSWIDPKWDIYYNVKDIATLHPEQKITVHKIQMVESFKDITPIY